MNWNIIIFKKLGFKRLNDDLKRLGYKYGKDTRKNRHKGSWVGLQFKQDYGEEDDERDDYYHNYYMTIIIIKS
jgi:hypothetical protein